MTSSEVVIDNLIRDIFSQFSGQSNLSLSTLTTTAVAITQSVIKSIAEEGGTRISIVINVLKLLAGENVTLSPADRAQLIVVIESVIPSVLAVMTHIEQGVVVLCEDTYDTAESWWKKCCSKKATTPITVKTNLPSITKQATGSPSHRIQTLQSLVQTALEHKTNT